MRVLFVTVGIVFLVTRANSLWDCVGNISLSEFEGLQALFNSTNGENWRWNPTLPNTTHWHFPPSQLSLVTELYSPCGDFWQGLNCSYSLLPLSSNQGLCSIQNISLAGMNLVGSIPSTLSQCNNIQVHFSSLINIILLSRVYFIVS